MIKILKLLDLFCGCGGFHKGFEMAFKNIKSVGIDNWKGCKETFEYNHPNSEFILEDIRDLNPYNFKGYDLVIGSPPCKEFSNANNNPDPDKGMKLIIEYFKWIKIIKPNFWIMENVPNVAKYLKWRIKDFKIPRINILNSANYGVPQIRKRCFAGNYVIPEGTHSKYGGGNYDIFGKTIKKWKTVMDAIGDIMFFEPNLSNSKIYNCSQESMEYQLKNSKFGVAKKKQLDPEKPSNTVICNDKDQGPILEIPNHQCFDNINENHVRDLANRDIKINKPSPAIQTKFRSDHRLEILPLLLTHHRGKPNKNSHSPFYTSGSPARTIASNPHSILTNQKKLYRRLTIRECARLQSFPDSFIFFGSKSSQYKMIGNAVPVLMAYHLARSINNHSNLQKN